MCQYRPCVRTAHVSVPPSVSTAECQYRPFTPPPPHLPSLHPNPPRALLRFGPAQARNGNAALWRMGRCGAIRESMHPSRADDAVHERGWEGLAWGGGGWCGGGRGVMEFNHTLRHAMFCATRMWDFRCSGRFLCALTVQIKGRSSASSRTMLRRSRCNLLDRLHGCLADIFGCRAHSNHRLHKNPTQNLLHTATAGATAGVATIGTGQGR